MNKASYLLCLFLLSAGLMLCIYVVLMCNYHYLSVNKQPSCKEHYDADPIITSNSMRFLIQESYQNDLEQYNMGVTKPGRLELESMKRISSITQHIRQKQKHKVSSLKIKYAADVSAASLDFKVTVSSWQGSPVTGCSFLAWELFQIAGERRKILCNSYDWFNGSYSIVCVNPGVSCVNVEVKVVYCAFQAFQMVFRYDRTVISDRFCFAGSLASPGSITSGQYADGTVVSWSVDANNSCENLYFDNVPQKPLSATEVCKCMERFDRVYFVGDSHIAQFSDYVMHTCAGFDMTGRLPALQHGSLQEGNMYYEAGTYVEDLYHNLQQNVDSWIRNTPRVAICIQTGAWDLYRHTNIAYSIEVALDYYERLIVYVKSRIKSSTSRVGFHILATPPRPHGHAVDTIARGAFSVKLQQIAERHGVSYIDTFAVLDPCVNDVPHLANNVHHYFQGLGNKWEGKPGIAFYRGVFLRTLCRL